MQGKLLLIPNSLGSKDTDTYLPSGIRGAITALKYFIVENTRNARRYLKEIDSSVNIDEITFFELNKHTDPMEIEGFLKPVLDGNDTGILSEAGLPGIADPGAAVVKLAHQKRIKVVPFIGPSSLFLALMASGLNGQQFRFNGYLPVKSGERIHALRQLEQRVITENETQLFIETPYRNNSLLNDILTACNDQTLLTIAADLTAPTEMVKTAKIAVWKRERPELNKRPAVFLLGR